MYQWLLEIEKELGKLIDNIGGITRIKVQTIMGIFNFPMATCDHTCYNKICVNNIDLT